MTLPCAAVGEVLAVMLIATVYEEEAAVEDSTAEGPKAAAGRTQKGAAQSSGLETGDAAKQKSRPRQLAEAQEGD